MGSGRSAELAERFKTDGMLAYVETVQRKEKEIGCDVLTHQKWCVLRLHCRHQSDSFLPSPFVCCVGVERTTLIESYPPLPPDHQVPCPVARTRLNIHSNTNVNSPKVRCAFERQIIEPVYPSRDA